MQYNTPAVPTFESFNPKAWADFRQAFTEYVKHVGSLEKVTTSETITTEGTTTFTMDKLKTTPNGMPLLPEAVRNGHGKETKKIQEAIIRAYITKNYSTWRCSAIIQMNAISAFI